MINSNLSISAYNVPPHPFANPAFSNVSAHCSALPTHLVSILLDQVSAKHIQV